MQNTQWSSYSHTSVTKGGRGGILFTVWGKGQCFVYALPTVGTTEVHLWDTKSVLFSLSVSSSALVSCLATSQALPNICLSHLLFCQDSSLHTIMANRAAVLRPHAHHTVHTCNEALLAIWSANPHSASIATCNTENLSRYSCFFFGKIIHATAAGILLERI